MKKLQVFDPPMCCSTGVCGPEVDPKLARFAADLDWVKKNGVEVERYNLSQQPAAFADSEMVKEALKKYGNEALPLLLLEGRIISHGAYPSRQELAGFVGLPDPTGIFTEAVAELVAIGAAIACNCEPCFKFHYDRARKLGVSKEDMTRAVDMAFAVKESPDQSIATLASRYLRPEEAKAEEAGGCCCGSPAEANEGAVPPKTPGKCCG